MKSLIRKRSTGRLSRALSQKNLQNVEVPAPAPKLPPRTFLLESPVQFTTVRYFFFSI